MIFRKDEWLWKEQVGDMIILGQRLSGCCVNVHYSAERVRIPSEGTSEGRSMTVEFFLETVVSQIRDVQRKPLPAFAVFQLPTTQNGIFWGGVPYCPSGPA